MSDSFDPETLARIFELLQSGEQAMISGGGRWSKALAYRAGQYYFEIFDEGQNSETPASPRDVSEALAAAPDAFRELLARPAWRRFFSAFVDGDLAQARAALAMTRDLPGPPARYRFVFEALLDGPEQAPSPELLAKLKVLVRDGMAVRAFRIAACGRDDLATTQKAVAYLSALGDLTGWPRLLHAQRADFHEQLGNLEAALEDCLRERKLEASQHLDQRIQRLRTAVRRQRAART